MRIFVSVTPPSNIEIENHKEYEVERYLIPDKGGANWNTLCIGMATISMINLESQ